MADDEATQDTMQETEDQMSTPQTDSADQELLQSARDPNAVSNALAHEREKAKQLKAKLTEYEDRDKTEQQKLTERMTTAEKRAEQAELKALRFEVAVEKGLTGERAALAKRLEGRTKEELAADADALLALLPSGQETTFDGGARGTPPTAGGMDGLIRAARRG